MSVLTRPQGVPERVWSLVGGLSALGGTTDRATLDRVNEWLASTKANPAALRYVREGASDLERALAAQERDAR